MKTETKKLIFPGNYGHASYCYYQIAFDGKDLRPTVVILVWDSNDGTSTPINNNSITDDLIINRILRKECEGIAITDLLIVTPHAINSQEYRLKTIPLILNNFPTPSILDRAKNLFNSTRQASENLDNLNDGNLPVLTRDPRPIENSEQEIVKQLFPMMSSPSGIQDLLNNSTCSEQCA